MQNEIKEYFFFAEPGLMANRRGRLPEKQPMKLAAHNKNGEIEYDLRTGQVK